MRSSFRYLISGKTGHAQPGSLRRATWRNRKRYFNRILILILLGGLFFLLCNFLYTTIESTRPQRIMENQEEYPEETLLRFKRNESCGGFELMQNRIKDAEQIPQDDPCLVQHVKTHLLTPPSPLPYNLESKKNNTSQLGQNIVVLGILKNQRNGFFIECGAWDGEFLSNTLMLERDFGWTGLLIEANPRLALPLRQKNRKAWTSTACLSITPFPKMMTFYSEGTLINNSYSMNRMFNMKMKAEEAVQVLCIPLFTYLLALKVNVVDYLSLDVEAADFAVLQTIPFDKIIFRVIEVEVVWVIEGKQAVRAFLEEKGYVFVLEMGGADFIFVHPSVQVQQPF